MPEGPELSRSRDHLRPFLVGRAIVNAFPGKKGRYALESPEGFNEFVEDISKKGAPRIKEVNVKGKFMWWRMNFPCEHENWHLWTTYGMSGQWLTQEGKHTSFGIYCNESGVAVLPYDTLYFNDSRHFGTLKFVKGDGALFKKLASLGPDMLNDPPTTQEFVDRLLKKPNKTLAEVLMDQSVISGVGNYVKAEALYLAELSPHRLVDSLLVAEMARLRQQIINVMKASYNTGGATLSTYRQVDGKKGAAQSRFVVYGNKTDPMGNPVIKEETLDGRTTHWVPAVQR